MGAAHNLRVMPLIVSAFCVCALAICALAPTLLHAAQADPSAPTTDSELLAESDRLATTSESASQYLASLALLERALSTNPTHYQILWRAARLYYKVGDTAAEPAKAGYFEQGITVGQQAVAQHPGGVEGHFWLGANYGGLSELQGAFKALKTVQKIRTAMRTVLQLQASYANGDAYRALGEIERQLPGILGGNLKRGIAYLEQGVQVAPQNLAMKLALAKAYRDASRTQESQQLLHEILQTPGRAEHASADSKTHQQARELLAN